jgi:thioredoxin 1
MDILLRFGIALLVILLAIIAYRLVTAWRLAWLRRMERNPLVGLGGRIGVPAILYFTTPDCVPCKTVQAPAIEILQAQFGERLQVIKIDAAERNDLADAWGVLSVPTTFIIDAQGQPRHVNNGVASAAKLRQQLRDFAGVDELLEQSVAIKSRIKLNAQ